MRVSGLGIRAVGTFLPERRRMIRSPGGHDLHVPVAVPESTTYTMAESAARDALHSAGLAVSDLEDQFVLACYETPGDYLFQMMGREVANQLGVGRIHSYNAFQGGNSSLLLLRMLAAHLVSKPAAQRGMILAPECWEYHSEDRLLGDAVLGDGSAALLLEKDWPHNRLRSVVTRTDGKYHNVVYNEVGGWALPYSGEVVRSGRCIYKIHDTAAYAQLRETTVDVLGEVIRTALDEAGVDWNDLDRVGLHTASPELHDRFVATFPVDPRRLVGTEPEFGYLGSAGPLLALRAILSQERPSGSLVLITSIGIDGNWAAAVLEV